MTFSWFSSLSALLCDRRSQFNPELWSLFPVDSSSAAYLQVAINAHRRIVNRDIHSHTPWSSPMPSLRARVNRQLRRGSQPPALQRARKIGPAAERSPVHFLVS